MNSFLVLFLDFEQKKIGFGFGQKLENWNWIWFGIWFGFEQKSEQNLDKKLDSNLDSEMVMGVDVVIFSALIIALMFTQIGFGIKD